MNKITIFALIALSFGAMVKTVQAAMTGELKTFAGMGVIIVWQDSEFRSAGMAVIEAQGWAFGLETMSPYISCVVRPGAKVVVIDAGLITHDVMVVDGKKAGCRGNIMMEELSIR